MQPLKPEEIDLILKKPGVSRADIHEYQKLQAERLVVNPRAAKPPEMAQAHIEREERLAELHTKLFG